MENNLQTVIRETKRLLRASMSGPVSASMREQGLQYKLNFGVDQPRLLTISEEVRTIAEENNCNLASLAIELWKEDIRESKILAAILMPTDAFDQELAEVWVEQIRYAEEAQALTMHLLVREPYAADFAFQMVSSERSLNRLVAWLLFGRLFSQKKSLSQRDSDELLDHISTELHDEKADMELRRTALNTLNKFMDLGTTEETLGMRILNSLN